MPAESRFRRTRDDLPPTGRTRRNSPGMPFEMEDPEDDDEPPRSNWGRPRNSFAAQRDRWWWPSSRTGRIFLGFSAIVVLIGITLAYDLAKTSLERDARFRITGSSHIQAAGLTEVTRAQILPVFGEDIGRNVFFVPLSERRKELEAIPWIQRATVMRVLPDQIRIDVVERKPIAFTRHGQQIGLVDANGVLLDMPAAAMAAHHYSFPVITGIDAGDRPATRQARMAVYERMMSELDSTGQHYSQQISEIDLTDPEDARVLMPEPGADILAHFGEDHFLERYQRYKAHIAEWRQQYPRLAAIDLRYEHQVVLEMTSGVTQPQLDASASDASSTGSQAAPTPKKPAAKTPLHKAEKKGKPGGRTSSAKSKTSPKPASSKSKSEKEKKRAQMKAVALKTSRKKPSPAARPTAAEGQ